VTTGSVELIAADLSTAAGCRAAIAVHPDVDILVNNLGVFEPKPFEDIPLSHANKPAGRSGSRISWKWAPFNRG
jgi:NAD(P)-dependent dehydrogenase (short-subunit alcohol dehydrogenase family)